MTSPADSRDWPVLDVAAHTRDGVLYVPTGNWRLPAGAFHGRIVISQSNTRVTGPSGPHTTHYAEMG